MGQMQLQRKQEFLLLGATAVHGTFSLTVSLSSFNPLPAVLLHGTQTIGLPFPPEGTHCIFKDLSLFQFSSSLY